MEKTLQERIEELARLPVSDEEKIQRAPEKSSMDKFSEPRNRVNSSEAVREDHQHKERFTALLNAAARTK